MSHPPVTTTSSTKATGYDRPTAGDLRSFFEQAPDHAKVTVRVYDDQRGETTWIAEATWDGPAPERPVPTNAAAGPHQPKMTLDDLTAVRSRYEHARNAGIDAVDAGHGWDESKRRAIADSQADVAKLHDALRHELLAREVGR